MTSRDLMTALALVGFASCVVAFVLALVSTRLHRSHADKLNGIAVGLFAGGAFVFLVSYLHLG